MRRTWYLGCTFLRYCSDTILLAGIGVPVVPFVFIRFFQELFTGQPAEDFGLVNYFGVILGWKGESDS